MHFAAKSKSALLALLTLSCAQERNPYKDRYMQGGTQGASASGAGANSGNAAGASGNTSTAGAVVADPAATTKAADAGAIAAESKTGVALICSNPAALAKFQAEVAVLCVDGKPTQAFATALAAPYKGGANPPLVKIKSVDNNGTSEFIVLAVIEIPKPVTETFGKRLSLNAGTLTAGNATVTQTVVSSTPAGSGDAMGAAEVKFDLNVSVGIIKVNNISILQNDSVALNPDKSIIATLGYLKPGAPDNTDDILSNSLSFMMGEGNVTKVIQVNHQMVNNKGQAATAEQTVIGIGQASMTNAYNKLSQ